jgi:hypothetical protein
MYSFLTKFKLFSLKIKLFKKTSHLNLIVACFFSSIKWEKLKTPTHNLEISESKRKKEDSSTCTQIVSFS